MSSVHQEQLILAFKQLGEFMHNPDDAFREVMATAAHHNAWFTKKEVGSSLQSLAHMLNEDELREWFKDIEITEKPKRIGLILAGNIPLVGFHDIICVLASGNTALIKLSSSDDKLLPALLKQLCVFAPQLADQLIYAERLKGFEAVIATGSNNTSRYFEYYFGKVPNIIRKSRNSLAILTGNESEEDIKQLGHDILDYFGMGCRSISKIFIPEGYDIKKFFKPIESFSGIIDHFKYNNNYDYNKSIFLINQDIHYDNGFLLLKKDETLSSPLAVLYYETYTNLDQVASKILAEDAQIQCVVGKVAIKINQPLIAFGQSQHPKLWDYADKVNTIDFLNALAH